MRDDLQSRLKSPVLWGAIAALIAFVAKEWFGWEIPGWDTFVDLALAVAVALGVVNNPTSKTTL